jgi:hypothetical protein
VNVVITLLIVVFVALWGGAVYGRLVRLRTRVKDAWAKKDRESYSRLAATYNASLAAFPGNLVGGLAGFKSAKPFESQ